MSDEAQTLVHDLDDKPVKRKVSKKLLIPVGVLIILIALLYIFLVLPAKTLLTSVKNLKSSGSQVVVYLKAQDLPGIKTQLTKVQADLGKVESDLKRLSWLKVVPWANAYYSDSQRGISAAKELLSAGNITVDSIAPYADIIGFKGLEGSTDGSKTAQDRVNFIINTIDKVKPQLSLIGDHMQKAKVQIDQIDPARYPESFRGLPIRSQLVMGVSLMDQTNSLVNDARPFMESLPYILGLDAPRKYLIIFQNDAELRPTGGFMTAYAITTISKGKLNIVVSDDIYALDAKFTKKITAPEAIIKYLPKVPYWYLRDQNLSPDFKASMDIFYPNYKLTGSPAVDGIIAIDTQVLVGLLKITGTVGVPGFGNFSADNDPRCNCPQAFYALENYADVEGPVVWDSGTGKIIYSPQNYGARKNFIGPLTYSIMANVYAQPKSKMGNLFSAAMGMIQSKHILFYFTDPKIQAASETFNLAGRVQQTDANKDYLMVVDTNFAGAKTNAWVSYAADQKIEVASDGTVTKTLTLNYKNPQQYFQDAQTGLKLNGLFRDWLRVYVPLGSTLIEAKGFETGQTTSTDLNKTVFEGFFSLAPLNNKIISLKYKLPFKIKSQYPMLIQKQGGSKDFSYKVSINGKAQPEFFLSSDKDVLLSF